MKLFLFTLITFLVTGCSKKNPSYSKMYDTRSHGNTIIKNMHEQGYYNCLNSGGNKTYCSQLHNYKE